MDVRTDTLPKDPQALQDFFAQLLREKDAEIERQEAEIRRHRQDIAYLEELVRLFRRQKFGPKSEQHYPGQSSLFNEAEYDDDTNIGVEESASGKDKKDSTGRSKVKPGRKPLPERLPRIDRVIDLSADEKICPRTGANLVKIGEEVSEKLDIVPAVVQVIRTIRYKYACPCKECKPKTAALEPTAIPKSMASAGLLAFVATAKYADSMPLYRQEGILQRIGCDIPRATLANWMIKCSQLVTPILNMLRDDLLEGPLIYCDETPLQVLKVPGKKATSRSYMWVQARWGPAGERIVIYDFDPSRSGEVPLRLLRGYKGYLQTDGYEGYAAIAGEPGVVHVGDWVHVRRKFAEAIKAKKKSVKASKAQEALDYIASLYRIEHEGEGLGASELHELRLNKSKPLLSEIRGWLDKTLSSVPPKSLTGKALAYMDKQWPKLVKFADDPVIGLDTNVVENAIRPFVVGRKNWMFADTQKGAHASAALYSLIVTARANGLEPYDYLKTLFTELPKAQSADDYSRLLPSNYLRILKDKP